MENMVVEEKKNNKKLWIILGVGGFVLLLGAAVVAGRLLGKNRSSEDMAELNYIAASELPEEDPESMGLVKEIGEGESLFVQEYSMNESLGLEGGGGGVVVVSAEDSSTNGGMAETDEYSSSVVISGSGTGEGPVVEVVISVDTLIYKDVTEPLIVNGRDGDVIDTDMEIKQEVELGDVDEIVENSLVTIWGERSGERIIADVILYQSFVVDVVSGSE